MAFSSPRCVLLFLWSLLVDQHQMERRGVRWGDGEDQALLTSFHRGDSLSMIAARHQRSDYAILCRLELCGLITDRSASAFQMARRPQRPTSSTVAPSMQLASAASGNPFRLFCWVFNNASDVSELRRFPYVSSLPSWVSKLPTGSSELSTVKPFVGLILHVPSRAVVGAMDGFQPGLPFAGGRLR